MFTRVGRTGEYFSNLRVPLSVIVLVLVSQLLLTKDAAADSLRGRSKLMRTQVVHSNKDSSARELNFVNSHAIIKEEGAKASRISIDDEDDELDEAELMNSNIENNEGDEEMPEDSEGNEGDGDSGSYYEGAVGSTEERELKISTASLSPSSSPSSSPSPSPSLERITGDDTDNNDEGNDKEEVTGDDADKDEEGDDKEEVTGDDTD
eukprot:CAMPEP_0195506956 /NCGR_PEP_ID=MMETSP0794_2-20130614/486_1 /TAXON_ID=515487 /ORGANISM="Stephanopyxis turris, Strain CCMP 815" /LENGTH=206 /DNA_ID=CAMNT_0040633443 /DNA_START=96 /DNA_END=713 /DNA_ORIENTATION=+